MELSFLKNKQRGKRMKITKKEIKKISRGMFTQLSKLELKNLEIDYTFKMNVDDDSYINITIFGDNTNVSFMFCNFYGEKRINKYFSKLLKVLKKDDFQMLLISEQEHGV